MLTAELKVIGGRQNGKLLALPKKFLIGREQDCHLRPNSDLVSRHHCAFTLDGYTLRLRDLGSTNGTFVNGERLQGEVVLKQGDNVRVGKLEFEVQLREVSEAAPASDQQFLPEDDSRILAPENTEQSSAETLVDYRLPTPENNEFATSDTGTIPVYDPQNPYAGMPQGYYPQMPPGYYPPQGMPGYPMPPGYAPYYMPQQPQPMPQQPATPPPGAAPATAIPAVRLPDPKETGVKEAAAPLPSAAGGGEKKRAANDSTNAAADLLNKMRERR